MKYLLIAILIGGSCLYAAFTMWERYRLRKVNEELRDRYKLLKSSLDKEKNHRRAMYRIAHEQEKIETIRMILREKYGSRVVSEHRVLDEIILYESARAKEASVSFHAEVSRDVERILLLFSENECISFFLNLIENAIEAAADAAVEEKKVELSFGKQLQIINSKAENGHPSRITNKSDPGRHGFGMSILETYCTEKSLDIAYTDCGTELVTLIKQKSENDREKDRI